jgi:predicted phosphoribosyltransferase
LARVIILVDDGAATGVTIIAAARWIRKWEQWLISMPTQVNAATDPTGKKLRTKSK